MGKFGVRAWAVVAGVATALGMVVSASPVGAVTAPTATLSGLTTPVTCDQQAQATVAVAAAPAPTGTVQFFDGATAVGTPLTLPGSNALSKSVKSSLPGVGPGPHSISFTYSGDVNYSSTSSAAQSLTFAPYTSALAVAPAPGSPRVGDGLSFQATMGADSHCFRRPPATTKATGSVSFANGSTPLGTGTLVNGNASFTTGLLSAGTYTINASYAGDANFAATTGATQVQVSPTGIYAWKAERVQSAAQGSTAVVFNNGAHTFFYDPNAKALGHMWWNGSTWATEILDGGVGGPNGRTTADVGRSPKALVSGGQLHVFYYDATFGDLRHAWYGLGTWSFESLDGFTGPHGRTNGDVGLESAAIDFGGTPQVFYRETVDPTRSRLRHAWWTGQFWGFETLDFGTNTGRFNTATVGTGQPHVFSYTGSNLRHGWWNGVQWSFENLDGSQVGPNGQISNNVGAFAQSFSYGGTPQVFYQELGAVTKLRHAWWAGQFWAFETLDGAGNNAATGATGNNVGADIAAGVLNGQPMVWYRDTTSQSLRHAFWTGASWRFDIDDGFAGVFGQQPNLGTPSVSTSSMVFANGQQNVFYTDAATNQLRHGWYG